MKMDGGRSPHFKPDWSPDTLRSHNYICHLVVIRRDLLDRVGGLREGFDGSQDYDLVLRATEQASQIHHIPKILYHWRQHPASMSSGEGKYQAYESARKAVREHLARRAIEGTVCDGLSAQHVRCQAILASADRWYRSLSPRKTRSTCWPVALNRSRGQPTRTMKYFLIENQSRQPRDVCLLPYSGKAAGDSRDPMEPSIQLLQAEQLCCDPGPRRGAACF